MIRTIKNCIKKTPLYQPLFNGYYKSRRILRKYIGRLYKFYTLRVLYPRIYKSGAKAKIDESKVVFIEVRMPKISDNFELLYNELKNNYDYKISTHFLRESFVPRKEFIKRAKAMVADIADAKYIFLNESTNILPALPMRKETVVTQLWHACGAFKKFGMSTADLIFGDNRKTLEKYPYHGNYTHVTVSSEEVVWAYEEAMGLKQGSGIVKPVGTSRTDVFHDDKFINNTFNRLYDVFPQARDKKIILYAPTFRGRVAKAKTSDKLDIEMFAKEFMEEYVILFKHHPFVKHRPEIPEEYKDFAADLTDSMSIEDLLCVSDICISDYSSLVFEYSLFEKPMIFFAYDLENYYDWRGFYYDYKEFVPGPIHTSCEEMIDYIKNIEDKFDKKQVVDFKNKFMSACDGHATERIMKLVFSDALEKHKR